MFQPKRMKRVVDFSDIVHCNCTGMMKKIYSFIEDNTDVLNVAKSSKRLYAIFKEMLSLSSDQDYVLNVFNYDATRKHYNTFSPFNPNVPCVLDPDEYITSEEEYARRVWRNPFISAIAKANAKFSTTYGFVSGSSAIFPMYKKWKQTYQNLNKLDRLNKTPDLDVYVLGNKQVHYVRSLIRELSNIHKDLIYNVYESYISVSYSTKQTYLTGILFCKKHVIDIMFNDYLQYPRDVFSTFDLDCCKIGFKPTEPNKCVIHCSHNFIRSMTKKKNYHFHNFMKEKTCDRIVKYFFRFGICTSHENGPLLSYFHTYTTTDKEIRFRYDASGNKSYVNWIEKNDYVEECGLIKENVMSDRMDKDLSHLVQQRTGIKSILNITKFLSIKKNGSRYEHMHDPKLITMMDVNGIKHVSYLAYGINNRLHYSTFDRTKWPKSYQLTKVEGIRCKCGEESTRECLCVKDEIDSREKLCMRQILPCSICTSCNSHRLEYERCNLVKLNIVQRRYFTE
jgi:hypothetical protein